LLVPPTLLVHPDPVIEITVDDRLLRQTSKTSSEAPAFSYGKVWFFSLFNKFNVKVVIEIDA